MMDGKYVFTFVFIVMGLVGCVTTTPRQQEQWNESAPVCYGDGDCKTKWAAARDWVQGNAGYKVQIYSDDLIETYNSVGSDPKISVSVTKRPVSKNPGGEVVNAIFINVRCGNVFGCVPTADEAITSFNRHVAQADINDPDCYSKMLADSSVPKVGMYSQVFKNQKVIVKRVCSGSPASAAGLKPNDIVYSVNGVEVSGMEQYAKSLQSSKFGDQIEFKVFRDGQYLSMVVQLLSKEDHAKARALATAAAPQISNQDAERKLESLSRMLDKGLITKPEYEAKKKQLLQDM